jgi:hypothetical protein
LTRRLPQRGHIIRQREHLPQAKQWGARACCNSWASRAGSGPLLVASMARSRAAGYWPCSIPGL